MTQSSAGAGGGTIDSSKSSAAVAVAAGSIAGTDSCWPASSSIPAGEVGDGSSVGTGISVGDVGCPRDLVCVPCPRRLRYSVPGGRIASVGEEGAGPRLATAVAGRPAPLNCGTSTSSTPPAPTSAEGAPVGCTPLNRSAKSDGDG